MAGIADLILNPQLEQIFLYNVVGSLITTALAPFLNALANEVNAQFPVVPLSPADAAMAVIRNLASEDAAAGQAAKSGVSPADFAVLVGLSGDAPAPEALAVALRRQLIDAGTYDKGIRQGRLRDEWADLIRELAVQQPTPSEALTAVVESQLSEAEGRAKFAAFGGMPSEFDWLLGTVGSAPSPVEAASMAHRGLIPWSGKGLGELSFEQAVAEGHSRTKWTAAYRGLSEYLPPPRTVTAMHKEGALTDAQAAAILAAHGLSPELTAAYLRASTGQKLAKAKELADSTVLELYRDRLIHRDQAAAFIAANGYSSAEAEYILEVEDLRAQQAAITHAVARVHTLYTSHKVGVATAGEALAQLGLDAKSADELLTVWAHERAANVKLPTPAQVESAFGFEIVDQATATQLLVDQGYSPHDAWLVLSVHHKAALPDEPPIGATTPAAAP